MKEGRHDNHVILLLVNQNKYMCGFIVMLLLSCDTRIAGNHNKQVWFYLIKSFVIVYGKSLENIVKTLFMYSTIILSKI